MDKFFTGKTIDDAVLKACESLNISQESISYEIVEMPSKGFLGIGNKPAKIKVSDQNGPKEYVSNYLKELFFLMGISDYEESIDFEENIINIQLNGEKIGYYTQRNTDVVESLQFLIAVTVNKEFDGNFKITLNINDYREKSSERLENLALKTAKQVLKNKRKITLRSMSSYQRRIIHSKLHDIENITTFSVGTEPNRKVVVAYDGPDKPLSLNEKGTVGKKNFDNRNKKSRGGGKPFNPSKLNKSEFSSKKEDKKVEKVKILYPGPGSEENKSDSTFDE